MNKLIALLLSFGLATAANAVTITTFGNASSPTFTVDVGNTTFTDTQNAASVNLIGSDLGSKLVGGFTSVDLTSVWGNDLVVSGFGALGPASLFNVTLFDSSGDRAIFNGGLWSEIQSTGSTSLVFNSFVGAFDIADVTDVDLTAAGVGTGTVVLDLSGLSMVPEPSAYAALAGLMALGYVMVRRRKA